MPKRYSEQCRTLVINLLSYSETHNEICKSAGKDKFELAADMLKISLRTIFCLKEPSRPSDQDYACNMSNKMKSAKTKISEFMLMSVREIIYKMRDANEYITIKSLYDPVKEEMPDFPGCPRSLSTWIRKIGFKFKKSNNRVHLLEGPSIQMKRTKFLRDYDKQKQLGCYQPVFLDETWIFSKGRINKKVWQDGTSRNVPKTQDEGCRYIIVHAGNSSGFVDGASLVFKANKKTGDYHDNMNRTNFENWFKSQLIPNLSEPSLIIMDNASYHGGLEEEVPCKSWTKKKLVEWLDKKGIYYPEKSMKDQIWEIVKTNLPKKQYHLDVYAAQNGHAVLRLPPYHCHFNAIEMVWSQCKQNYDKKIAKTKSTEEEVLSAWKTALSEVSSQNWRDYTYHVEGVIASAWEKEKRLDLSQVQELIISLSDSDTSDDEDVEDFSFS